MYLSSAEIENMVKIDGSKPILVTGGTGYIASWIVKYLLDEGHTVHTTVRNVQNRDRFAHLETAAKASKGRLKVFEADLLRKNSFLESMEGCELVIHTASPFFVTGIKDPERELVTPALEGTRNVLDAVNASPFVRRVVLTSSCASIYGDNADIKLTKNGVFTEEYWNTTSSVSHNPYSYSKKIAEEEAWKIASEQSRWDLISINPAFVLGPSLTKRTDSTSISTMIMLGNGTYRFGVPELWFGITDVRDVARSHILAGFSENASGRHIICSDSLELLKIAEILKKKFGSKYAFPGMKVPFFLIWLLGPLLGFSRSYIEKNIGAPVRFDNSWTKQDLGLQFTDAEKTITDHFQQLIEDGLV
ncbi:MAG TPA: NAD-dependent epimerase/dehydratase family protein [Leptospiraceae bacterium]|nr:NAD-dependent epimerase/dehydratase family protein [Leptospiraceae bacterium]